MATKKETEKKPQKKQGKAEKNAVAHKEGKAKPIAAEKEKKVEEKKEAVKAETPKFASAIELQKSGVDTSIVFYPLITEKAVGMIEAQNKLCFIVSDNANKTIVKNAIETMYGIKIRKINIVRDMKGRKKAIVKLDKKYKADEVAMKLGVI